MANHVHCYYLGKSQDKELSCHSPISRPYWDIIAEGLNLRPIPESTLRWRLKKIGHSPRKPASFIFQIFPRAYLTGQSER
jgi:hypothetical protein